MIGSKIWKPTRLLLNKFAASPEMEKARWKFCVGRTYESSASRRASGHYGGQVLRLGVLILMWSGSRESDCLAVRLFSCLAEFGGLWRIMSPTPLSQISGTYRSDPSRLSVPSKDGRVPSISSPPKPNLRGNVTRLGLNQQTGEETDKVNKERGTWLKGGAGFIGLGDISTVFW